MRLKILLLATGAACLNATAQIQVFESSPWTDVRAAAQNDDGVIIAAGSEIGRWGEWSENQDQFNISWSGGLGGNKKVIRSERSATGQVFLLWEDISDHKITVDFRATVGMPMLAHCAEGPGQLARVLVDSHSNIWITEAGLNILKFSKRRNRRDESAPLHTILTDELYPGGDPTNRLPVSMVEDARGRVWFWSSCLLGDDSRGAVQGVLIGDENGVTNYPALSGVATNRISEIASLDATNFWIAVRAAGIFAVDADTLRGTPVAEPETNAFRLVQKIFTVGADRYVIAGGAGDFNQQGLTGSLWRQRAGRWQKLLDGLDSGGTPEQFAGRQWLATTNGLWLTGFGTGGWFVPHGEGLAFQTDWRIDLPFSTIDRWFKWKDGQILGIQFGRGGFIADETALLANSQRKTSVKIFQTDKPLIQTADGEIFGFFRGQPRVLQEWDGKTWREHPLPEKVQLNSHEILTDSLNRVWWIHLPYGSPDATPSYLFDPARGKFEIFANYPAALQAQLRSHPGLQIGANEVYAPKFSADGRICFEDTYWKLYYFNGHTWREWEKAKISSPQTWYQSIVNPFFASDGSLSITLKKSIWQFTELEGWRSTNSAAEAKTTTSKPTLQRPPAIAALSRADSLVTDRLGTSWFTADNRLFRSAYGQNHAWFSPTDAEPFVDGRKLVGALIDKAGNVFLKTSTAGHEEYVYSPMPFAAPDTSAKRIREDGDTVQIELAATGTDTPRFSWRVDDEPWSVAQTGRSVVLDDLPAGQHRFQAVAINDRFQADATPAEVTFETRTAPTKNIAKWIAQLGDKNFAMRAAAVKYLSHHADVALPALQQARDQETDRDRRWWLDAAIQQCK